ncbi:MerR family transcriptional regulator, partial [Phyllobacterium sp.]|nr:MerR family transcriptional regulator [Phyllobacterium sp.]
DVDLLKGIRHLLYDQGYTIKGVQRLLRENGAQFIIALGSGDTAAAEAISQQKQAAVREEEAHSAEQERADAAEEAAIMGSPKSSSHGRRLFGLIKGDDDGPVAADGKRLSKDNRTLLQETLFDLLECKRLLDQVR